MECEGKTKQQLVDELSELSHRNAELQTEVAKCRQAEDAFRNSEARYRSFIESSHEVIFSKDRDGRYRTLNLNAAIGLGGSRIEDVEGKTDYELLSTEQADSVREADERVRSSSKVLEVYEVVRNAEGEDRIYLSRKWPSYNEDGEVDLVNCFALDITERRQAEEALTQSEENYRTLFETMTQGVVYQSTDGSVINANPAAERILGLSLDQLQGRTSIDPRWKAVHEDGSDFPGEEHPSMVALKTRQPVNNVTMGVFHPGEGRRRWITIDAVPHLRPGEQRPHQVHSTFTDITERKQAEEALRESEEKYRSIIEDVVDASQAVGLFILDSDFQVVWVNQALAQYFALDRDEIIGRDKRQLIHEQIKGIFEDSESFTAKVLATYDDNTYAEAFECHVLPEGERKERWLEHWSQPIRSGLYAGGRVELYVDITDRKEAEEAQRKSEARERQRAEELETLLDAFPAIVWVAHDPECRIITGNRTASEFLRMPPDANQSKTAVEDESPRHFTVWKDGKVMPLAELPVQLAARGIAVADFEEDVVFDDGTTHHLVGNATPLYDDQENVRGAVAAFSDITERKQAEVALREGNARMELATRSSNIGMWDWDLRTDQVYFSPEWKRQIGYEEDELPGRYEEWESRLHPEDRLRILRALSEYREGTAPEYAVEFRLRHKDGSYRWIATRGGILLDDTQQPYRMLGCHLDVTERREAEGVLQFERARAQQYLDVAGVMLIALGADQRVVLINPKGCEILGYSKEEILGHDWFDTFLPDEHVGEVKQVFDQIMSGNVEPVEYYENPIVRKDGSGRMMAWHNSVLRDSAGQIVGLFSSGEDITDRKRMEEELIRLERLRATGELSAGVSHNLNNILTSVLGPAQLLKRMTDDPKLLREIEDIVASATRARDLVRNLHKSTRTVEEGKLEPVRVDSVIREAVQATRPRWKDESEARGIPIEVETQLGDVPTVRATESGLHEILVNLLFNAADALPEGGLIIIGTRSVGDQVELTVSDAGIGMDEETRRRVFEPFFTTKADVGTGLGLSTAYAAVQRWGGTINVASMPAEGTTFTIRLPVWDGAEPGSETPVNRPEARRARLLVVEDDVAVAGFLERVLEATHEVVLVLDGREALDTFATDTCDVALVDLGMPGVPGDRIAQEMRERDPALVTVLITGWEIDDDDARLAHFDFRIRKPFDDLDQVEDVVAQAVALYDTRAEELG